MTALRDLAGLLLLAAALPFVVLVVVLALVMACTEIREWRR